MGRYQIPNCSLSSLEDTEDAESHCLQEEGPVADPSLCRFGSVFYVTIRLPNGSFCKMKVVSHWDFHTNGLICVAISGMSPWIRPSEGLSAAVSWLTAHSQRWASQTQGMKELSLVDKALTYTLGGCFKDQMSPLSKSDLQINIMEES